MSISDKLCLSITNNYKKLRELWLLLRSLIVSTKVHAPFSNRSDNDV